MALAKRQRFATLPKFALALIAALTLCMVDARADVVGIGDITPSKADPFPENPGDQIPDLPQFGGPVTGSGVLIVGGTGATIGGTSTGQMTIDIPSDTAPLTSVRGIIAGDRTGFGLVRILGLNSEWNIANDLIVGNEGQGFLELVGGARLFTSNRGTAPTGTTFDMQVGAVFGSQGFITIDGFGSLVVNYDLGVGVESIGSIEVINFGRLESANSAVLGDTFGEGYVRVEGRGSRWNIGAPNPLFTPVGGLTIGNQGRGVVEVFDQGLVFSGTNSVLGLGIDSFGEVLVSGRNSQFWTVGDLVVGVAGNGRLEINDRGLVRADGVGALGAATIIGGGGLVEFGGGTLQTPEVANFGVIRGDGRIQSPLVTNNGDIRTAAGIANLRERLWITGDLVNNNYIDSIGGEMEVEGLVTNNGNIYGDNAVFRFRGGLATGGAGTLLRLNNTILESPNVQLANLEIGPDGDSTIVGNLTLGGGTLEMTIGDHFETFNIAGLADLSGDLLINFEQNYIPVPGDSFELIDANAPIAGAGFNEPIFIPATPGVFWDVDYSTPGSVFLNALGVAPPNIGIGSDFDNNDIVDGADLAILRANFGLTPATQADGDADGDGIVDGSDFLKWQRQVGTNPVFVSPVPEPSTVALALLTALAAPLWRRRT